MSKIFPNKPDVLFGQKRVGESFSPIIDGSGPPIYLAGREISNVANDLRLKILHPDQLAIEVFWYNGQLVSANTRSLSALSEAGLTPTNIKFIMPNRTLLSRLDELPIIENASLPGPRIPVTKSKSDLKVIRVIEIPGYSR